MASIHFLYNSFEDFTFSEYEPRTEVKARQIAAQPHCCSVLDKLSWTRRRAESWFMNPMCLRSLVSQRVLQGWVIKKESERAQVFVDQISVRVSTKAGYPEK